MSYLSRFKHDIFVSYAHRKIEQRLAGEGPTWTRQVVEILQSLIEENLAIANTDRDLDIYQDIYSHEKDRNTSDILKAVYDSGILLGFVSRRFSASKWLVDEATAFKSRKPQRWRDDPGKTGIFLIEIEETPQDDWPGVLKDPAGIPQIAIRLHHRPHRAAASQTLGFPNIAQSKQSGEVYEQLSNLAIQIGRSLESLAREESPLPPPPEKEPVVYLGYTPKERRLERKQLADLLAEKGVRLCPQKPLSAFSKAAELSAYVRKELSHSRLAVQLLSDNNGTNELTTMQIDLAKVGGVRLLMWRPETLNLANLDEDAFGYATYRERFKDYVEYAETGAIEAIADTIVGRLGEEAAVGPGGVPPFQVGWPTVLVFSGNTAGYRFVRNELEPKLDDVIDESKWKVVYPGSEIHSPTALKRFYEENIADCDAVIVVRCEEDGTAVRDALQAFSHDAGVARGEPIEASKERETLTHTLDELGREFKHRTPDRDFYVGVVYGPPPGMKIEFGKRAHVFDCSTRQADKHLYLWLKQVRKQVTTRRARSP